MSHDVQVRRASAAPTLATRSGSGSGSSIANRTSRRTRRGGTSLSRITWTPNADGRVRQFWEASRDEGKTWMVVFDGTYVRMK